MLSSPRISLTFSAALSLSDTIGASSCEVGAPVSFVSVSVAATDIGSPCREKYSRRAWDLPTAYSWRSGARQGPSHRSTDRARICKKTLVGLVIMRDRYYPPFAALGILAPPPALLLIGESNMTDIRKLAFVGLMSLGL